MGCPEHLYLKTPTADLEENKPQLPDEVDNYLEGKEIKEESKKRIEELYYKTEHKRQGPITVYDKWWK